MKALEASAHATPGGADSQGTAKWLNFAASRMSVLLIIAAVLKIS
jgi:hypothetical protein